jgi:hypothetical protein
MQRLEVSGAVRSLYGLLGVKGLIQNGVGLENLLREAKIYFEKLCIAFKTYHSD